MIINDIEYTLKDGRKATIRSPKDEDIQGMLDYLYVSAGETEFVLRYPEECSKYTAESEKKLFERINKSDNEAMLVCVVDGKIAGNCQIVWSKGLKTRHRAMVAIALLREFWNQGIGTRFFQELIRIAEENRNIVQIELEFIEGNVRAKALYEKMGFRIVGVKPNAIRLKDGTLLNEYSMIREVNRTETVEINGENYVFSNQIGNNKAKFDSFNKLAGTTFGIRFSSVGGEYEPHTLCQGDKVCANISVNQMPMDYQGQKRLYIQLGTVMTDEAYRGRGLSRWLMEWILNKWKGQCDAIYLFANDSVLDFYPKFGFEKQEEYACSYLVKGQHKPGCVKLDMSKEENQKKAAEKYLEGQMFSKFFMERNMAIFDFYATGVFRHFVYELPEEKVIVFAEQNGDTCCCYDIFGKTNASLTDILDKVGDEHTKKIALGFTPKDTKGMVEQKHKEEDTTLFILQGSENLFIEDKIRFPEMSHA